MKEGEEIINKELVGYNFNEITAIRKVLRAVQDSFKKQYKVGHSILVGYLIEVDIAYHIKKQNEQSNSKNKN